MVSQRKPTREEFLAANLATFRCRPISKPAQSFVEHLADTTETYELQYGLRERRIRSNARLQWREAVGALAADLLRHSRNTDALGCMYRPVHFKKGYKSLVSRDSFKSLSVAWGTEHLGFLESWRGIRAVSEVEMDGETLRTSNFKKATRLRATPKLIELATQFHLGEGLDSDFALDMPYQRSIVLKGRKTASGHAEAFRGLWGSEKFKECSRRIERLNEGLSEHRFGLLVAPKIVRHFNNADHEDYQFDQGGRLYGADGASWQNLNQKARLQMKIDGQEVAEIDVRASHLFILHALHRSPLKPGLDPYSLTSFERDIAKMAVLKILGSADIPVRWPDGTGTRYRSETGKDLRCSFPRVRDELFASLPVLREAAGTSAWTQLQFEESECFLSAMETLLYDYECPSLPVHDSLVVPKSMMGIANEAIRQAYQDRLGATPDTTIVTP